MGLYERPERPTAFAFLDLTGYTRLTEERGDEAAVPRVKDHRSVSLKREHKRGGR
jgi:hypothetical protein